MRRPIVAALIALVLATPAAAQNACAAKGSRLPTAGGWAEYRTPRGTMRMAYLGHEERGERMEMAATTERGNAVFQVLVPGFPYEMTQAVEIVMQQAGQPAMRLPQQMMGMMGGRMPNASAASEASCARMTRVGSEEVTVAAGKFQTVHWRDTEGGTDVWVSDRVAFGAVKVIHGQETMELTAHGTGATSQITGAIQDMPGMGAPGGRRPRN